MFWITLVAFLVILGLLVFVHELGHFSAAKFLGVKVEEFAFGFPPRLFCKKRGETRYCINAIPFGGYVKMLGEDEKADSPRSFSAKKARVRLVIVVAGVVMNFLLAGVLFSAGYMVGMTPIRLDASKLSGVKNDEVTVAQVVAGSVAEQSGIKEGDVIKGFSSAEDFSSFTKEHRGETVSLDVKRGSDESIKIVTLGSDDSSPFGVAIYNLTKVKLPFFKAVAAGFYDMVLTTGYIAVLIFQLIIRLFSGGQVGDSVAGPVKIFNVTGEAVQLGWSYILQFAALLSINIGLVNILPFPALDGGRAALIILEGIFRKKVLREDLENIVHTVGFVILIALIAIITMREVIGLF